MLKIFGKMSKSKGIRLKSAVVVPNKCQISFKVFDEKGYPEKLLRLKSVSHSKRKCQSDADRNDKIDESRDTKSSKRRKTWSSPSTESLTRHADFRPLGVEDDWGPLSHKHELMPMDNVRYWHQHRCEVCDKLFEHKHKQRGDQSMNYNKHVCNVCGGTSGSKRVEYKNSQPLDGYYRRSR